MADFLKNESRTGNVDNEIELNEFELRLSQLFGKYGTGLAIVPEVGVKSINDPSK